MQRKFNVNLILCEAIDEESKTVYRMFNEITTDEKHTATFKLVTFINSFGDVETDGKYSLHYYLMEQKLDDSGKRKGIYLGAVSFMTNAQENSNEKKTNSNTFAQMKLEKIPFINENEYHIEAYMVEGSFDRGMGYSELKEKSVEYRKVGELVSISAFDVKFPVS